MGAAANMGRNSVLRAPLDEASTMMHLLKHRDCHRKQSSRTRYKHCRRELRIHLPCLQLQHHASSLHQAGCSFQTAGCTAEQQCQLAAAQPLLQEAAGTSKAKAARAGAAWAEAVAGAGRGADTNAKVEERALVADANTWQAQEDALHQNELQQVMAPRHTCGPPGNGNAITHTFCLTTYLLLDSVSHSDGLRLP